LRIFTIASIRSPDKEIGIHKQVGEPKKVRKKGLHLLCFEKGEIGGLTFFSTFFSIVEFFGNTQMIARRYKTYIRRFGEEREKKKGNL
jgi:hypothetical protein